MSGEIRSEERSTWLAALLHRWPTLLAIGLAAVFASGTSVGELSSLLPMLAFIYLAAAALQHREATWPLVVGVTVTFVLLSLVDVVNPLWVLVVAAVVLTIWGALGRYRQTITIEAAGMVGFTSISLVALSVDPELGRYVIAAGWFGHAIWDFAHLKSDKVVSRSFAEWCSVFDVLRALGILLLPM